MVYLACIEYLEVENVKSKLVCSRYGKEYFRIEDYNKMTQAWGGLKA